MSVEMNTRSMTVEQKLSLQPQQNIGECEDVTAAPDLKQEAERLKTFPVDWNCTHSAAEFAAEGFFCNDADKLQCVFCNLQVQTEMDGERVKDMHKQNRCPFLGNKFTGNVPINAQVDEDYDQSLPADAEILNVNLQRTPVGAITRYEDRKYTFVGRWSLERFQKAPSLARAGFSLLPDQNDEEDPRKIKCYQCEVEIYVAGQKTAFQLHQDANPNCPLVKLRDTFSNLEPEEQNIVEENSTVHEDNELQNDDPEVAEQLSESSQEEIQSHESQDGVVNALNQFDGEVELTQNIREQTSQSYQEEYQIAGQIHTGNNDIIFGPMPGTSNQQQGVYYDQTHSIKSDLTKRLETFQRDECPPVLRRLGPHLAESGFYFTGDKDIVRCFHCNILLGEWDTSYKPWKRHALSSSYILRGAVCRCVCRTQTQLDRFFRKQRARNPCRHQPKIARIGSNEEDNNID